MEVAFIGFGELGAALAREMLARRISVRAYVRDRQAATNVAGDHSTDRIDVDLRHDIEGAVRGAELVVAAVPAGAAVEIARAVLPVAAAGTVYLDPTPLPPDIKRALSEQMSETGVLYADVAVLGTVAVSGAGVPLLASGPGASRLAEIAPTAGLAVTAIGLEAGHATTVKLVRSAYMKGRDALVVETLVAARRLGVLDAVLDSIRGPGEEVPFRQLADRLLGGVALHADRRAGELADAAAVLSAAGVEPLLADAGTVRLRRVAASGEAPARRPDGLAEFLPLIDARLGSELDDSGGRAAPS